MRQILHILTKAHDALPDAIVSAQQERPDQQVIVVDLNVPEPDYRALLQSIFAADSIQVW